MGRKMIARMAAQRIGSMKARMSQINATVMMKRRMKKKTCWSVLPRMAKKRSVGRWPVFIWLRNDTLFYSVRTGREVILFINLCGRQFWVGGDGPNLNVLAR